MTAVRIPDVSRGVIADVAAEDLPLGAWSEVSNVMFAGGMMTRAQGMGSAITPTIVPYWLSLFRTATSKFVLYFGTVSIFAHNGTTETNVSKAGGYTGGAANRWTGGQFKGYFVANNGVDQPQYWNGNTATDFANMTGWTSTTKVAALRTYKDFLIGLNTTESGTRFPYRVMWSDAADPGSLPSWTVGTGTLAGNQDLPDIGPIVDGLTQGDEFIVYSTTGAQAMRFIGGQSVMSFRPLPGVPGIITQHCVVDTPVGHVGMSPNDVWIQAGGQSRSICDGRVRKAIFDAIDNDYAERCCFLTVNPATSEVWVCYPEVGSSTCTRASVWNWVSDTWTFRTLRNVTAGAFGQAPAIPEYTFETITGTFGGTEGQSLGVFTLAENANSQRLLFAHADMKISIVGRSYQDVGVPLEAVATRKGLSLDDPQTIKLCRGAWPRITGTVGGTVYVRLGAHDDPGDDPTWQDEVAYTIGSSQKVDAFASGRYLAYRVRSEADIDWKMRGLELDVVTMGRF